jgi:hypothetical protein
LYLKEVELERALDNNLVPGTKYAHFEYYTRTPKQDTATENAILPLLKRSDEPAVQALGNKHLVSREHFATLVVGIQTAMGMSGHDKMRAPGHGLVRAPKKKALDAAEKLLADNFEERRENRLDVMNYAKEAGVFLPIARDPTPTSQKDATKARQRSRWCEDGEDKVFCGHHLLCATNDVNEALDKICPGRHGHFSPGEMEHAHTWAVCEQRKQGIWGVDTCHDVHLLQKKCHKAVDAALRKSLAADRRAEKEKAAERTKKRTYIEISSDEEDEEDEEVALQLNRRAEISSDEQKRTYIEISSDEEDEENEEVALLLSLTKPCLEVFECYACGEPRCECPPRLVGA